MSFPGYDAWKLDTPPRFEDLDQAEDLDQLGDQVEDLDAEDLDVIETNPTG